MPLSWRFIISWNWRRLAPWRTCAEHLIHSLCCKTGAVVSAGIWVIPVWTTGLGKGIVMQCWEQQQEPACIPIQTHCLSCTVRPCFTTDGVVICNQSPSNAQTKCTVFLSVLQSIFLFIHLYLSLFDSHLPVLFSFSVSSKRGGKTGWWVLEILQTSTNSTWRAKFPPQP